MAFFIHDYVLQVTFPFGVSPLTFLSLCVTRQHIHKAFHAKKWKEKKKQRHLEGTRHFCTSVAENKRGDNGWRIFMHKYAVSQRATHLSHSANCVSFSGTITTHIFVKDFYLGSKGINNSWCWNSPGSCRQKKKRRKTRGERMMLGGVVAALTPALWLLSSS